MKQAFLKWTGKNIDEMDHLISGVKGAEGVSFVMGDTVYIATPGGDMLHAKVGDWVVRSDNTAYPVPREIVDKIKAAPQ